MKIKGSLSPFFICIALLYGGAEPLAGQANQPWTGTAFSAPAKVLLQAANAATEGEADDVVVLFEEARHIFDAGGRDTYTWRRVYKILSPRGVEDWSTIQSQWSPWYQERPAIRARVITADGHEYRLDPKTIGESPLYEEAPATFSDARLVEAPLPAVAAGSVVEYEIVKQETAPFFEAGSLSYFHFGAGVPTLSSRLVLEAPAELPLRYTSRMLPGVEARREEAGGRVRWTFEAGRLEAVPDTDWLVASDVPQSPHVVFSTGKSWAEVAGAYARVVETQTATGRVEEIAAEAIRGAETQEEKITRLLERMRRDVRYAAVEFGDAAIVPRSPRETIERQYGDCKDQATLFIALLRAAGIEAHMALLNTDFGPDVEVKLPGLGVFDHSIVYIPGEPPVWVDTTHEFSRPNQLPVSDQGRRALIAAEGTTELVVTPASEAFDNRVIETREFYLSDEDGPARVVETTEAHGAAELSYRSDYAHATPEEVREWVKNYANDMYLIEEVDKIEHTDPFDLSQPFRLRFEARKARRGWTDGGDAGVAILPGPLVNRLPEELRSQDETEEEPESPRAQADRVLPEPFVLEWRYRVAPPPGYQPHPLPTGGSEKLGPATFSKEFRTTPEGEVTATLRFDSGPRRFSREEMEQLRERVTALKGAEAILVRFASVGEAHLEAGRIREALTEFRRLENEHSDRAVHRRRIARALLAGGMGEAARAEARRAIELQPDSALAHRILGWTLQHDLIGRRFGKGFDHAGAVAAYRRALELNPDEQVARADLAILLEHNAAGVRYAADAPLQEAIAEYRKIPDVTPSHQLFNNLPIALFRAGRYDEVKELLRSHNLPAPLHYIYLGAVAATDGAARAQAEASTLVTDAEARRQALLNAGQNLIPARRYTEAAELLIAGAQAAQNPAAVVQQAELLKRIRRHEDIPLPADDPRSAFRRFFQETVLEKPDGELERLFATPMRALASEKMEGELRTAGRQIRAQLARQGIVPDGVVDIVFSTLQMSVDGDATACCRIRTQSPITSGGVGTIYVVKEEDEYRILGFSTTLGLVGQHALRLAEAGDLEAARRWLDWARDERPLGGGDDLLAGSAFARFWTKGNQAGSDRARTASALLLAEEKETAAESIPVLLEARARAAEDDRVQFDLALATAYSLLGRWEEALAASQRLAGVFPQSNRAFSLVRETLGRLKRLDEIEQMARERLERLPNDAEGMRTLAQVAQRRTDFAEATRIHQHLVELGKAEASDYNNMAWQAMFDTGVNEEALEHAQRAARMSENKVPGILHTLACLYAEAGKTTEARQVALHAMDVAGMEEPDESFWFVFGRIAEEFGEKEAAVAAYRKAIPEEPEADPYLPTSELARKRLAGLGAAAGETGSSRSGKPR